MKIKGVSTRVSEDFYRMMERMRYQLKVKNGLKIKSHTQLTQMIATNPKMLYDKTLIKNLRRMGKI